MNIHIHPAVSSISKFIKDLMIRKQNLFIFSNNEKNIVNQILSYSSKEHSYYI